MAIMNPALSELLERSIIAAVASAILAAVGISLIKNAERIRQWELRFSARHERLARFNLMSDWPKSSTYNIHLKCCGGVALVMAAVSGWALVSNLIDLMHLN